MTNWVALFSRLEKAVSDHERDKDEAFKDEVDERLHSAYKKVMQDACIRQELNNIATLARQEKEEK